MRSHGNFKMQIAMAAAAPAVLAHAGNADVLAALNPAGDGNLDALATANADEFFTAQGGFGKVEGQSHQHVVATDGKWFGLQAMAGAEEVLKNFADVG